VSACSNGKHKETGGGFPNFLSVVEQKSVPRLEFNLSFSISPGKHAETLK